MGVTSRIRRELFRRVSRLERSAARASWRRRNRERSYSPPSLEPGLADVVERLRRDGLAITDSETVFRDPDLFEAAAAQARGLYEQPREETEAEVGSKATFLTKLATATYPIDDPFARLALHPDALEVANSYLELLSTVRVLDLWLTRPSPGPAIQTQLWHRDSDDLLNVKMFVYFSDVTCGAGPLCYAPGTHPLGASRILPEHDAHGRSTDKQLSEVVPEADWVHCEGGPGTVVFADTCGYHKQAKPTDAERLLLVSQYVSGTPFVERSVELTGVDAAQLTDAQYVAVFDRMRDGILSDG